MKRIRIGNDIRVQTSLHDLNDFDITSIKQLRCYFIPQGDSYTTPNDTYDPMQYNICNCGKPKYNVFPCNIDAPHWFCGYNGFGVNSKRFIHVDNKFLAPSRLLAEQNRIEAYFPAKAQYQIGEYKFVIVLTIYQPGWCEDNLRTITLDEGVIFALTSDDRDTDNDTTIDLDVVYAESIEVPNLLYIHDKLDLGEADQKHTDYNVTINYSDGSQRKLDEYDFHEYISTSVVNNRGNIQLKDNGRIANDDMYSYVDANVTYSLRKGYDEDPVTKTIRVLSEGKIYRINYHCPGGYNIKSNDTNDLEKEIYVTDEMQNEKSLLTWFSIVRIPGTDITFLPVITGVTATNCTLKHNEADNKYELYAPVTGDIDINVLYENNNQYYVNYTTSSDLRVEGDDELVIINSEISSDKQFGQFTVFDKRTTKNLDDIIVTSNGCVVKEISRDTESIKYGINGPITTDNGIINVNISIKSNTPHVTSITVPDKITLSKQPSIGIEERDFVNTVYKIWLNYSDGSRKSVTADEFGSLMTVEYALSTNISVDDQTGQINKLDRFKDINTEITYSLREDQSIQATTQIVSAGKYHTIKYVCPGVLTVNGPEELFIYDTVNNMGQSGTIITSFTVTKTPGASGEFQANEVTGDGCTITKDANDSNKFHICTPVTKDNITITIVASNPFEE